MSATLAFTGACSADLESFLPNKTADSIGRGQKKKVSEKYLEHKMCHHKLLPFSLRKYIFLQVSMSTIHCMTATLIVSGEGRIKTVLFNQRKTSSGARDYVFFKKLDTRT